MFAGKGLRGPQCLPTGLRLFEAAKGARKAESSSLCHGLCVSLCLFLPESSPEKGKGQQQHQNRMQTHSQTGSCANFYANLSRRTNTSPLGATFKISPYSNQSDMILWLNTEYTGYSDLTFACFHAAAPYGQFHCAGAGLRCYCSSQMMLSGQCSLPGTLWLR